jgi:hypothetical protein
MPTFSMRAIPEPKPNTRSVFTRDNNGEPFMRSTGDMSYTCAKCEYVLVEKVGQGQVSNIVFQCPACGTFNEIA